MTQNYVAKRLNVNGIVQGVGFRPFVYQLAHQYGLKGEVSNTASGVSIHVEGAPAKIASFEKDLFRKHPPLAHIVEISAKPETHKNFPDFSIAKSSGGTPMATLISPDVSVCNDCLQELFDSSDRRFRYPFINCTNCGPRYTIIDDIPYDRPKTSMKHFRMCPACRTEYEDPTNRRFHAQPNACPDCGPHVTLCDNRRNELASDDPLQTAADLLKQGAILAVKGLGGYHLAADAENSDAVSQLRMRKRREEKPLAVMSPDLTAIRRYARIRPAEKKLLLSIQRPIVLLKKKKSNPLSDQVSPRNNFFGVMLPYTPLHYILLKHGFTALVMTSGNLSEEPIAIDNDDAFERLADIADYFITHNRDIYLRSDDTILRHTAGNARLIRRSRGFVPIPVFLKNPIPPILACGAELKSTVCLAKNDKAFLSQHIGDLENTATYDFFTLTIEHLQRILEITPELIAHDMHPDYLSTGFAEQQENIQKIQIQHHHAHIASCMAENKLDEPVIGLSFDGTGYGIDGKIWGGEILIAETHTFERVAHMAYVPMPGGAAAIKEPWRMAISYLRDAFGPDFSYSTLPHLADLDSKKIKIITEMTAKGVNSPMTSSLGRLFDGVAAITGVRNRVNFEGQAAMEFEMMASGDTEAIYEYAWKSGPVHRILPAPIISGVVSDIHNNVDLPVISAKFHATLIRLFSDLCGTVRKESGLKRVVLSGGVFQNSGLLKGLLQSLTQNGFSVFTHQQVPTNDGGIALGQAVAAAAIVRR